MQKGIPTENEILQKYELTHSECPPFFDLTNLADGNYFAYLFSCGLGGQIEIKLTSEK